MKMNEGYELELVPFILQVERCDRTAGQLPAQYFTLNIVLSSAGILQLAAVSKTGLPVANHSKITLATRTNLRGRQRGSRMPSLLARERYSDPVWPSPSIRRHWPEHWRPLQYRLPPERWLAQRLRVRARP